MALCLLRYCADSTAAVFGAVLLASDPMYLLTIRWDWGPAAIQHLCLIGALLLFVRFHRSQNATLLCLMRLIRFVGRRVVG